jgi:hypothetical protein
MLSLRLEKQTRETGMLGRKNKSAERNWVGLEGGTGGMKVRAFNRIGNAPSTILL